MVISFQTSKTIRRKEVLRMGDIQIAWTFMRINHEQFKQNILEHEQVLKTMIEKGYTCVKPYGTEEDKVKE
ncbi:MAG: hypothetical protein ACJ71P_01975 [Nitrososphaeraceae archaeon]